MNQLSLKYDLSLDKSQFIWSIINLFLFKNDFKHNKYDHGRKRKIRLRKYDRKFYSGVGTIPILVWRCLIHCGWRFWSNWKHHFHFDTCNEVSFKVYTIFLFRIFFCFIIYSQNKNWFHYTLFIFQRNEEVFFQPFACNTVLLRFGIHFMLLTSPYISYIWTWKLVLCQKLPIYFIPLYGCFLYRQYLHDPLCYHRKVRSINRSYFIRR